MSQNNQLSNLAAELEQLDANGGSLEQLFSSSELPAGPAPEKPSLAILRKIPVKLTLEVDSIEVMLGEVLNLSAGEVLPLDKKVGEPLDVRVNGTLVARAEVVVVDGKYGLRLTDVLENLSLSEFTGNK